MKRKSAWEKLLPEEREESYKIGEKFKEFLNNVKTEWEAIRYAEKALKEKAHRIFKLKEKIIGVALKGELPLEEGLRIVAAHVDTPRIDLKVHPLYEKHGIALFETHYYGGIKKYQWLNIPLSLHGRIVKENGKIIEWKIGEESEDPVFVIPDLLPHLAYKQMEKKASEFIEGETLDIVVGNMPIEEEKEEKEKVKLKILKILKEKYDIEEEDFVSSDIEAVPAYKAQDIGFDKSMIGGYGQDDRICAFAGIEAFLKVEKPKHSILLILADREEIGSFGISGLESNILRKWVIELLEEWEGNSSNLILERTLWNSKAISADVHAAVNPLFEEVHEIKNAALLGYGIAISRFTGVRGKAGGSEADAEYTGWIRRLFNENNIAWQAAELGKVDEGGGGTVAKFLARFGVEVVDCGPPLLNMHSPFEISSKADLFSAIKGYKVFFES
ncbi:MAG: aminopeptidase [Synergistetes bacterium]|nr:aminopeptidase [Synergistota bacterium]MCX8127405.1 aminopeptidase [Synergistota bacterium]MDW8192269.1 aminopeptidase [Synergistota bacterium]